MGRRHITDFGRYEWRRKFKWKRGGPAVWVYARFAPPGTPIYRGWTKLCDIDALGPGSWKGSYTGPQHWSKKEILKPRPFPPHIRCCIRLRTGVPDAHGWFDAVIIRWDPRYMEWVEMDNVWARENHGKHPLKTSRVYVGNFRDHWHDGRPIYHIRHNQHWWWSRLAMRP
jgi:hypothetical protein